MKLRQLLGFCGLLPAMTVLPVEPSDIDQAVVHNPVILIDVSNNIAVLEGNVASLKQSQQAERLIFSQTGIDWIENKLKINPGVQSSESSDSKFDYIQKNVNPG